MTIYIIFFRKFYINNNINNHTQTYVMFMDFEYEYMKQYIHFIFDKALEFE